MLFDCFISYLFMRVLKLKLGRKKILHISLCFSASRVKRSDGHVLASGRAWLCQSHIWQHAVRTSMYYVRTRAFCFLCQTHTTFCLFYHVVLCVFSQTDPKILAFSAHLFSFPGISFDFPYSLNLWFFLEYWNIWLIGMMI
jgi:hypothetical protein